MSTGRLTAVASAAASAAIIACAKPRPKPNEDAHATQQRPEQRISELTEQLARATRGNATTRVCSRI